MRMMVGQFSTFLHPGLAWGALALAALPLLVHLLNRQRHRRVPWAAMVFLLSAQKRSRRRMRLEQILLLVMRTLAILAIGCAIARPVFTRGALAGAVASRTHRVIVLDDSLSMRMKGTSGASRFAAGVETVRGLLDEWPATDPITLLTTTGDSRVRFRASLDRRQMRNWVGTHGAGEGGTHWPSVLDDVEAQLAVRDDAGAIVIVTDLAAGDWQSTGLHERVRALAEQAVTHLAGVGEDADNVGIHAFEVLDPLVSPHHLARCQVDVHNAQAAAVSGARVAIRLGPRTLGMVDCPVLTPFSSTSIGCAVRLPAGGVQVLEARLEGTSVDSLAADDRRLLALDVQAQHPVLIVEGGRGGGGAYLSTALAPVVDKRRTAMLEPVRMPPEALVEEPLEAYRLVALCGVAQLALSTWQRLERYLTFGGGLLIGLGDGVDLDDYTASGYRGGAGVLPVGLEGLSDVADEYSGGVALALDGAANGFLALFADYPESSLFRGRTWRYARLSDTGARGEVLARFENGDAALVAQRHGLGRCLLWATSLDMSWTNLPAKGDFVSLVQLIARDLARCGGAGRTLLCGDALQIPLDARDTLTSPWLEAPDGKRHAVDVQRLGNRDTVSGQLPQQSGVFRLVTPRAAIPIAVNVDPRECDPAIVSPQALSEQFGGAVHVVTGRQAARRTVTGDARGEPTVALLAMGFVLLLGETWLASWFTRQR